MREDFHFNVLVPPTPANATTPQIVYDRLEADGMNKKPLHFRMGDNISGSAQFTSDEFWQKILPDIQNKIIFPNPVFFVDLREETHCFVRLAKGDELIPISWYADNDLSNLDLPARTLRIMEAVKVVQLNRAQKFVDYRNDVISIVEARAEDIIVESVTPHSYLHIPCTDHCCPSVDAVNILYREVTKMTKIAGKGKKPWYHFHCHAGKGRTTTFMTLVDIIWNSKRDTILDILNRSKELSDYDLMEIPIGWKQAYVQNRLDMIYDFYQYCRDNND